MTLTMRLSNAGEPMRHRLNSVGVVAHPRVAGVPTTSRDRDTSSPSAMPSPISWAVSSARW